MSSQTLHDLEVAEPPESYGAYHNYTLQALTSFQRYLLYMARFYETMNRAYIVIARENFNQSAYYREKGIEESMSQFAENIWGG
jgi:hypothetical protein